MGAGQTDTPAARSTARSRRLRLWWLVFTWNPFWTTWVGFLYAGLRAKKKRWVATGVVYGVVQLAGAPLLEVNDDLGALLTYVPWLIGIPHALAIRNEYLERRDVLEDPRLRDARLRHLRRELAGELARENPRLALDSQLIGSDLVDINRANARQLAALPGVSKQLARKIVHVRDEIGGFSSLYDMGHVLDLPAPVVDGIADRVVCLPRH